jgi:hypothetical protein
MLLTNYRRQFLISERDSHLVKKVSFFQIYTGCYPEPFPFIPQICVLFFQGPILMPFVPMSIKFLLPFRVFNYSSVPIFYSTCISLLCLPFRPSLFNVINMLEVRIMYNGIIFIWKLNYIKSVFVLKVIGVVSINVTLFWDMTPCDVVRSRQSCWSTASFWLLPQRFWQWFFFATVCTSVTNHMLSQKKKVLLCRVKYFSREGSVGRRIGRCSSNDLNFAPIRLCLRNLLSHERYFAISSIFLRWTGG